MKKHLLPSLKLTLVSILLCCVIYPAIVTLIAQLAPGKGDGEKVYLNGKAVGYANVGQLFTQDQYFWGRPSAVNYNAAGSGGSNKAASNPEYVKTVQERIDSFIAHNPGIQSTDIPAELVTASGSGLDPDISAKSALIQIKRIAQVRNIPEARIKALLEKQTQQPLFGLFGPSKVNVLKLNLALDQLK
jgi:K+-transporting ATPase ATPase C chain